MKEVRFLAGLFFDFDIPIDKFFIFKYFRTDLEKQFVKYYLCFGEVDYFTEHTGYVCRKRWKAILKKRFDRIMLEHDTLKKNFELEKVAELERGKYKFD